jgi:aminodeoxyfutalosine synthase
MPASVPDLYALAASHDIITIGAMADEVRRRLHGARTTFVRVADIPAAVDAPIIVAPAAGEVRIVGPIMSRADAMARVRAVAAEARTIPLSGFSLADLEELAARESVTLRQLLEDLRAAGLELVAHAPIDRLRDPRRAIEEVNIAGLALARLTVDQLPTADVPSLLERVSALQREVAVIRAFAPLPRRPNPLLPTTGYDDVKRVALARLFAENIPSIQVDWSLYGPKLAQVALTVGADDVDAVSPVDDASEGPRRATRREIERQIRAASLDPIERNGRFELVAG